MYPVRYGRDAGLYIMIRRSVETVNGEITRTKQIGLVWKKKRPISPSLGRYRPSSYRVYRISGPSILTYNVRQKGWKKVLAGASFSYEPSIGGKITKLNKAQLEDRYGIKTLRKAPWFESAMDEMMWVQLMDRT